MSEDGTTALKSISFSKSGAWCAYSVAKAGSDWVSIKIRNVESGEDLPEELEWVKFSCIEWTHDNKGFFYNRYETLSKNVGT